MSNENFESLMRDVARAVQGDARRRQLLPEIQARLERLDEQSRQAQRAHGTWRLTLLGATACAAGIAMFVLRPMPLSYAVDGAGAGRVGAVGEPLAASEAGPLSLRFSDGSQVTLPPHAQAQVDALDARGATVALEGGTVDVSVVHRAKTRWSIRAGRYEIRVTGTKFLAGWDRKSDTLTVTMREGSVEVTGPGMKAPARVVGGQRLRAKDVTAEAAGDEPEVVVEDATMAAAPKTPAPEAATPPPAEEAPAPSVAAAAQPEPEAEATPEKTAPTPARNDRRGARARHAVVAPTPSKLALADAEWRTLDHQGYFKDALAAAIRDGFEDGCARLPADDVARLGDTARLAGDYNRAELAYKTALRRFSSPPDRVVFLLGKIELDQHDNPAAAAKWFETYLQRFPRGQLAREASGLLLVSRINSGDNAGARAAATSYLQSFPDGPHASKARAVLGH